MEKEAKVAHINGMYLALIAFLGLVGTLATLFYKGKKDSTNPPINREKKDEKTSPTTSPSRSNVGPKKTVEEKKAPLNFSVLDSLTGEPIPNVKVVLVSDDSCKLSSETGQVHFLLSKSDDKYEFIFLHDKYKIYKEYYGINSLTYPIKLSKR